MQNHNAQESIHASFKWYEKEVTGLFLSTRSVVQYLIFQHDQLIFFIFCFNSSYCMSMSFIWVIFPKLKPQDSFGEFDLFFFLIFRKCRKSSENTIRPSSHCFEWHIVMQYCPMANYHYVHNLWWSVRGDSEHFDFLDISWKWKHFWANCKQGIDSSYMYNSIKFCINKTKTK